MDQAAHHEQQLLIQHRLYELLVKAENNGFTADELSLMAHQFGIQLPAIDAKPAEFHPASTH